MRWRMGEMGREGIAGDVGAVKPLAFRELCRENWVTSQWELEAVWVEDFVRNCQKRG